ncbi:MAG: hypothetical protein AAF491_00220 [Verrucomicrobiota bacterium]
MALFPSTASTSLHVWLGTILLFFSPHLRSQEAEGEAVSEIPSRFFQTQDSGGYFWQAAGNGALTSGDTQYLQSGLNWLVDGVAFAPTQAVVRSPDEHPENAGVSLEEVRDSLFLARDLWIDRERGGVRVLDTIQNRSGSAVSLEVVQRTTYPFAWQSLHGVDGELLSKDPVLNLDPEDFGLVVHFSAAEGRHDTFFVVSGGEDVMRPRLSASSNRRELSFSYRIVLPAGGSQSLLHWISQKSLPDLSLAPDTFVPFFDRGSLVDPEVSSRQKAGIANFSPESLPGDSVLPGEIGTLLSLHSHLDALGAERLLDDVQWISRSSQITGTVSEKNRFKIHSRYLGEISLALADIAAIQGSPGTDKEATFFLRNGEVRVGQVLEGNFTLTPEGASSSSEVSLSGRELLLLAIRDIDGRPPGGGEQFVQTIDGSVFAIRPGAGTSLPLATPWGQVEIALESLYEISQAAKPFPSHRIMTEEGSRFSAFLSGNVLKVALHSGEDLSIPFHAIERIWRSGATEFSLVEESESWLSLEDIPDLEEGGVLLQGNAFLHGTLPETTLKFSDDEALLSIESSTVRSLQLDYSREAFEEMRFLIELSNGEVVSGKPLLPFLPIIWEGKELRIPFESLLAFQIRES